MNELHKENTLLKRRRKNNTMNYKQLTKSQILQQMYEKNAANYLGKTTDLNIKT